MFRIPNVSQKRYVQSYRENLQFFGMDYYSLDKLTNLLQEK